MFKSKHIAVYVTGGIAVYKSLNIVRALIKEGAEVQVIMTEAAQKFVTPLTFSTLSKRPVLTDNFSSQSSPDDFIPHIKIARWSDVAVVVPATANVIAKMANGIADDLTTTALMATTAPKVVFPTMNTSMLEYPPVQKNLQILTQIGIEVVEPASGFLAEGENGKGRLPELLEIMQAIDASLSKDEYLTNQRIVVTAGGTKEPIDPVRYIGNRSSGKMGIAMAKSAGDLGATVTLISTVKPESPMNNVHVILVNSADEMMAKVQEYFNESDVLMMAAAVSDFKPINVASQKIKKSDDQDTYQIELIKNPDILKTVASKKTHQFVVGFAAETENLFDYAKKKLVSKNADVILANDVSQKDAGFNVDNNRITVITKNDEPENWTLMSKTEVANKFWEYYRNNFLDNTEKSQPIY